MLLTPTIKKSFLPFFLFFLSLFSLAQEMEFQLMDGNIPFDIDRCIARNQDFESLSLKVIPSEGTQFEMASLTMELDDSEIEFFNDYTLFNSFDLESWLLERRAFRGSSELKFDFLYRLQDSKNRKFSFIVCVSRNGEPLAMSHQNMNYVKLPIFFATDRNYSKDAEELEDRFGNNRSSLKFGMCEVSVPNSHEMGQIESPSVWKFEFWEDPEKHIMMHSMKLLEKDAYFRKLSQNVRKSKGKSSFLFVHGYNVSFMDAAKRTAQMTYDLKFDGEPVFYSWPSKASTSAYTNDEATIQWSKLNIEKFLRDYLERSDAEQVYLIAHSMGNRGLTRALISLLQEKPELGDKIQEVILAAPDIDADVFKQEIAPKMAKVVQSPITLYVSAEDAALKASHLVHGYRRAGDAEGDLMVVEGVETIDATGIDTSFLGHSYFTETKTILDDIFQLITTSKRAFLRPTLEKKKQGPAVYWKVKTN